MARVSAGVLRNAAIAVCAVCALGMAASFAELLAARSRADDLARTSQAAQNLLSTMKDLETGYRGFVIAGSEAYLDPYRQAEQAISGEEDRLRAVGALKRDDVDGIVAAAERKRAYATSVIAARARSFDEARAMIEGGRGRQLMDDLRRRIAALETSIVARRSRDDQGAARIAVIAAAVSLAGLAASGVMLLSVATRDRRRSQALQKLIEDVFERAPVGLALIDRFGVVRQTNSAFIDLVGSGGAIQGVRLGNVSRPLAEVVIPDVRAVTRHGAALAPDPGERRETVELVREGRTVYAEVSVFPVALSDDAQSSAAVGLVLTDMTRQREWEAELESERDRAETANRAKSAFIANMSHELRTPITAVLGYCELLEEEAQDLGETAFLADLGKIAANARHLLGLINDVLDFSKMEAEKLEVHPVQFTLRELLQQVEDAAEGLMAKNRNAFRIDNASPDAVLVTDDLRVRQILLNLIGNAAKFTNDGQIVLNARTFEREGAQWVRLAVVDSGIGMTPEQLANLFNRFSQADETTTRKYGGTGLGLALSKSIAALLGGDISVESAPQKGSTFAVELPCAYIAPAAAAPDVPAATEQHHTVGPASPVLVIDDDPYAREFLSRVLTRAGFAVMLESDGPSGLATARRVRPIAILLDVMMPGLDGWHVLRTLRADPQTADIPVIVQTVLDDRNFAYALGATAYLHKPIAREQLTATVADVALPAAAGHALVVDDDADAAARVADMLGRDGWSVVCAGDGAQALAEMAKRKPDLALVDLLMPGMDGYSFVRRVRENPEWDDMRIVVLTADDVRRARVRELAAATSKIVQKGETPLADLVRDLRRFAGANTNHKEGANDGAHIAGRG